MSAGDMPVAYIARNNAAHAGSGDAVDRDVVLFHPLNHANFSQSKRAPATESQTNARTMNGSR